MPRNEIVLIVDDDLGFVHLLQRSLMKCGVENIDSVTSGMHATKYIEGTFPYEQRLIPDLIFLDLRMSGMDGLDLLGWLQRPYFKNIPVIVLSGSTDPRDRARSLELGATAFYQKPLEATKLDKLIEQVFEEHAVKA